MSVVACWRREEIYNLLIRYTPYSPLWLVEEEKRYTTRCQYRYQTLGCGLLKKRRDIQRKSLHRSRLFVVACWRREEIYNENDWEGTPEYNSGGIDGEGKWTERDEKYPNAIREKRDGEGKGTEKGKGRRKKRDREGWGIPEYNSGGIDGEGKGTERENRQRGKRDREGWEIPEYNSGGNRRRKKRDGEGK